MCQSIAEGGRRCAAHTRPKYLEARDHALNNSDPDYSLTHGPSWSGFSPTVIAKLMDASLDYASTPSGNVDILKDIKTYREYPNYDMVVGLLEVAQAKGLERLEEYKSIKSQVEELMNESNSSTALTVAATLGATVPAPVGSSVFILTHTTYYDQDSSVEEIGVFPTRELAEEGLIKYKEIIGVASEACLGLMLSLMVRASIWITPKTRLSGISAS